MKVIVNINIGGAGLAYYRIKVEKTKKLLMSKPLKERILNAQVGLLRYVYLYLKR